MASDAPGAIESKYMVHLSSNSSSLSRSFPSKVGGLANLSLEPGIGAGAIKGAAGTGIGAGGNAGNGAKGVGWRPGVGTWP